MAGGIGGTPVGAAIQAHAAQMRKPPITQPGPMDESQNDYSFALDPRLHPQHPLAGFRQPGPGVPPSPTS